MPLLPGSVEELEVQPFATLAEALIQGMIKSEAEAVAEAEERIQGMIKSEAEAVV